MKRISSLLAIISVVALTFSAAAVATATDETATTSPDEPMTLAMGPPLDHHLGGWTELARGPSELDDGRVVKLLADTTRLRGFVGAADRLVAVGQICESSGWPCSPVAWSSADGLTWTAAAFPGTKPTINDIAATRDGSVAVGLDRAQPQVAAVWTPEDGVTWKRRPAPPTKGITEILRPRNPIVVLGRGSLWSSQNGRKGKKLGPAPGVGPVYGPGGYLSWAGGTHGDFIDTRQLWHSRDGNTWTERKLPKRLRGGFDRFGMEIHAVGDRWLLIPNDGKLAARILISKDGKRWRAIPRPPGMDSWQYWVEPVGNQIQATGVIIDASGFWAWQPGKKADPPMDLAGHAIGAPVAWRVATSRPVPMSAAQGGGTTSGAGIRRTARHRSLHQTPTRRWACKPVGR
jgi:hypothetical protein